MPVFGTMAEEVRFVSELTTCPFCPSGPWLRSCSSLAFLGFSLDTHALGVVLSPGLNQNQQTVCLILWAFHNTIQPIVSPKCLSSSSSLCITHILMVESLRSPAAYGGGFDSTLVSAWWVLFQSLWLPAWGQLVSHPLSFDLIMYQFFKKKFFVYWFEREWNITVREKHQLVASYMHAP